MQQSEERFRQLQQDCSYQHPPFITEFHTIDLTKERLADRYEDPEQLIDLTSCQFALHYSFESLSQADMMLRNACERLRPGGFLIGTIPNERELLKRLQNSDSSSFGNAIYTVTFDSKTEFPLFGCKYHAFIETSIDCPEFLVHFKCLEKLAQRYHMQLVYKQDFTDFYADKVEDPRYAKLLLDMDGLEVYPPAVGTQSFSDNPDSYKAAQKKIEELKTQGDVIPPQVATLSQDEWEVSSLFIAFAFKKLGSDSAESKLK